MVIEDYVEFGMPLADIALQYGEQLIVGLSGAGIFALLKKSPNSA
mgnify:CR=1 FL=1|jgi:hypothetical protein